MNLSKYFKHSDSFQPEDILKVTPVPPVPVVESSTSAPSTDISPQQDSKDKKADSDKVHTGLEENGSFNDTVDPGKYIEISEVEKKLEEAYEAGVQKGFEKRSADFESAGKSLLTICEQLETVRDTIIANSSREIQKFAMEVAERIVRHSLRDDNNTIIATIDEALQRAVKSDEFYVYINPDDYDMVAERSSDLIAGLSGLSNIVIKKDATVEKGGAKIESDNCTIDATIASQFDVIREELKKKT
ncbi:MAG: hypothetical protein BA862_10315 [Desulfobulbaceae bacterium S3730MH12]|nr:MAG: hypothetical protein BA862_10315 [Desulfobulbaceae bacterium S3730MH12]